MRRVVARPREGKPRRRVARGAAVGKTQDELDEAADLGSLPRAGTMDTNRLAKELKEIQADTTSGVTVRVLGDNMAHMQGTILGASPTIRRRGVLFPSSRFRSLVARHRVPRRSSPIPPLQLVKPAGPEESPYQGGKFVVDIQLTNAYPFEPPKMRFITKVWHPNVSSANGAICLDILKEQW